MRPRDVLNRLKWDTKELENSKVTILHRGAPGDRRVIEGNEIRELGKGFMGVSSPRGDVEIPYHRVLKIEVGGQTVWERKR